MSIISIKSFNIYDIGYLLLLVFYFIRYLYLLKTENITKKEAIESLQNAYDDFDEILHETKKYLNDE